MRFAPASKAARSFQSIPNSLQNSCRLMPREVRLIRTRLPIHMSTGDVLDSGIHIDCGLSPFIACRHDPSWHRDHPLRSLNAPLQP
jgi:hypothetical protein